MIPDIIFGYPFVVSLFRTHRDRKTSEPVFWTKFGQKNEGLERPNVPLNLLGHKKVFQTLKAQ